MFNLQKCEGDNRLDESFLALLVSRNYFISFRETLNKCFHFICFGNEGDHFSSLGWHFQIKN